MANNSKGSNVAVAKRAAPPVTKRAAAKPAAEKVRAHDEPLTAEEEAALHEEVINNRKFDDRGYPLDATHDAQGFPLPPKRSPRSKNWKEQRPSFGE